MGTATEPKETTTRLLCLNLRRDADAGCSEDSSFRAEIDITIPGSRIGTCVIGIRH